MRVRGPMEPLTVVVRADALSSKRRLPRSESPTTPLILEVTSVWKPRNLILERAECTRASDSPSVPSRARPVPWLLVSWRTISRTESSGCLYLYLFIFVLIALPLWLTESWVFEDLPSCTLIVLSHIWE